MTVKELITHLQTFDEKSVITLSISDEFWNVDGIVQTHDRVILFNGLPLPSREIEELLT